MSGQFIWTLTMTDICTQWTECRAVWNKGSTGVIEQIKDIELHLPFDLLGFDCDNGSEFLNYHLLEYFGEKAKNKRFQFTRSRPNKKNDNAHVEQRNWSHPRQLFGQVRLDNLELVGPINDLYRNEFSLYHNHFCPTMKLKEKISVLSKTKRIYGVAQTPYRRVIESSAVGEDRKQQLQALHATLDPILLKERIEKKLRAIFALRKRLQAQPNTLALH